MSERRWVPQPWINETPLTDAEVLAEMGAPRYWVCWQYGTTEKFQHCRHDEQGMVDEDGMRCGWYHIRWQLRKWKNEGRR